MTQDQVHRALLHQLPVWDRLLTERGIDARSDVEVINNVTQIPELGFHTMFPGLTGDTAKRILGADPRSDAMGARLVGAQAGPGAWHLPGGMTQAQVHAALTSQLPVWKDLLAERGIRAHTKEEVINNAVQIREFGFHAKFPGLTGDVAKLIVGGDPHDNSVGVQLKGSQVGSGTVGDCLSPAQSCWGTMNPGPPAAPIVPQPQPQLPQQRKPERQQHQPQRRQEQPQGPSWQQRVHEGLDAAGQVAGDVFYEIDDFGKAVMPAVRGLWQLAN